MNNIITEPLTLVEGTLADWHTIERADHVRTMLETEKRQHDETTETHRRMRDDVERLLFHAQRMHTEHQSADWKGRCEAYRQVLSLMGVGDD